MFSQLSPISSRVNCHSLVIAPITYGYMWESLGNQDKLRWRWIKAHVDQTCLACTESFEIYALLKFTHYYVLVFFVFFFSFLNSMLDNTNEYIQFSFVIYLSIICSSYVLLSYSVSFSFTPGLYTLGEGWKFCMVFVYTDQLSTISKANIFTWKIKIWIHFYTFDLICLRLTKQRFPPMFYCPF